MLKGKHITIYVSGGIAAYKALNIVRALIKLNAEVQVVMTYGAQQFVTPLTFATLSQRPVITDNFHPQVAEDDFIPHINVARWTDLAVVVPATANIIGKMANGIADDIATTSLMATTARKIVFPAMNTNMWEYPPVQKNLETLKAAGVKIVEPASGFLAEGESGKGRLPDLATIISNITDEFQVAAPLKGKKIIVTAGGTKEPIDPVRYIGNNSSGKMGIAMAEVAAKLGADVQLVTTVNYQSQSDDLQVVPIKSASEMLDQLLKTFDDVDVLVMAAAVADFKPLHVADQKIKKQDDQTEYTIQLTKNPDILKTVAKNKQKQFVVGFAAETQNLLENATKKLESKNADVILANDVSQKDAGFNVDTNRITLLTKNNSPETWPLLSKYEVAQKFWDYYINK